MQRRLLILGLVLALLVLAGIGLVLKLGRAVAKRDRLRPAGGPIRLIPAKSRE